MQIASKMAAWNSPELPGTHLGGWKKQIWANGISTGALTQIAGNINMPHSRAARNPPGLLGTHPGCHPG